MEFKIDLREEAGSLQKQLESQGYAINSEKLYQLEERRYAKQKKVKEGKLSINQQMAEAEYMTDEILDNAIYIGTEELKVGNIVEVVGHEGHCKYHRGKIEEIMDGGIFILSNQGLTNEPYFRRDELKLIKD